MNLLTAKQRLRMVVNGRIAQTDSLLEKQPVVKLYTPDGAGTWLLSAIDPSDADRAWGLCDVGLGTPELGWVSIAGLEKLRGKLGMAVRRDGAFAPNASLGAYVAEARRVGIIVA